MGATPLWQERAQEYRARGETRTPPRLSKPTPAKERHDTLPLELLTSGTINKKKYTADEVKKIKHNLEQRVLAQYGIFGDLVRIVPGPVITRYEFEPADGIKFAQIEAREQDIALRMKAKNARVSLIPGKAAVGIDIPNEKRQIIRLRSVLESMKEKPKGVPLFLGVSTTGTRRVVQLDDIRHLLIGGTTGGGKSTCLNALIASWLMWYGPHEIKLALVDPKKLEFTSYSELSDYLFAPVAVTPVETVTMLEAVEDEMADRYGKLQKARKRNIGEYNLDNPKERMPYLVLIIDELADLMLQVGDEIEGTLQRLAQLARAVGIHLIAATQSPRKEVITGVIKANFPARIAFAVASDVDSRVILDQNGAKHLLGEGDMLYLEPGAAVPERIHGAYVSSEEIERVVEYARNQN